MRSFLLALGILFALWTAGIYIAHQQVPAVDTTLLYGGNVIVALLTLIAYWLVKRSLSTNPNAFVRGVYGGTLLKMMVLIIALMVYVMVNKEHMHKPSLFIVFGIYALYAAIEAYFLGKLARRV